jgi:hypothetical protein
VEAAEDDGHERRHEEGDGGQIGEPEARALPSGEAMP